MRRLLLLLLVLPLFCVANAGLKMQQFAKGQHIIIKPGYSLYKVALDKDVYQGVSKSNLTDIRVFNGAREAVPFAIQLQEQEDVKRLLDVPFFPYRRNSKGNDQEHLFVKKASDGTIISISNKQGKQPKTNEFLLDLTKLKQKGFAKSIKLTWVTKEHNWLAKVTIRRSQNLNHWYKIGSSQSIADFDHKGQQVEQNSLQLTRSWGKYLLLQFNNVPEDFKIERIQLGLLSHKPGKRQWVDLTLTKQSDGNYEYKSPGYFPISALSLPNLGNNNLIKVRVSHRRNKRLSWLFLSEKVVYQLSMKGKKVVSDHVISFPAQRSLFWKVQTIPALGHNKPLAVKAGWRPATLIFVANGSGPYTLAYGNITANTSTAIPIQELKQTLGNNIKAKRAFLSTPYVINGKAAYSSIKNPKTWQKIVLWLVLGLGVIVILIMAMSLIRQNNKEENND